MISVHAVTGTWYALDISDLAILKGLKFRVDNKFNFS